MNDYKRFVSYIYVYHHDARMANVGSVKVEVRQDKVTMLGDIHDNTYMSCQEQVDQLRLYFIFYIGDNGWVKVPAKCQFIRSGNQVEFRMETDVENMLRSTYSMEQNAGLQICNMENEDDFCATIWMNQMPDWKTVALEENVEEGILLSVDEEPQNNRDSDKGHISRVEQLHQEYIRDDSLRTAGYEDFKDSVIQQEFGMQEIEEEKCKQAEQEVEVQKIIGQELKNQELGETKQKMVHEPPKTADKNISSQFLQIWQKLDKTHAKCLLDKQEPTLTGMKIQLCDFEGFPASVWNFASNPFVLHGFYHFRHVLFAKDDNHNFFIGVPGIYHERESVMGAVFGFPKFVEGYPQMVMSSYDLPRGGAVQNDLPHNNKQQSHMSHKDMPPKRNLREEFPGKFGYFIVQM